MQFTLHRRFGRIIDVGSEWRTFASSDKDSKDMCRVGAVEDPTMGGSDLSTTIGRATGSAGFDENGKPIYRNRFSVGQIFSVFFL
jgi:transcription initiation factor TFIIB